MPWVPVLGDRPAAAVSVSARHDAVVDAFRPVRHVVSRRAWVVRQAQETREGQQGTVLVLLLGFAVLAVLLVAVVTDASALYLTRRSLAGAADGAALAAVQQLDREALYTGPPGEEIPLDPQAVLDAVRTYVATADLEDRFDDFEVVGVQTGDGSVTVTLQATRRLPFLGHLSGGTGEGVVIEATATARAPFVD